MKKYIYAFTILLIMFNFGSIARAENKGVSQFQLLAKKSYRMSFGDFPLSGVFLSINKDKILLYGRKIS